jgi:hypothetical protein
LWILVCPFSVGHCIVCPTIYSSDYPFDIFKLFFQTFLSNWTLPQFFFLHLFLCCFLSDRKLTESKNICIICRPHSFKTEFIFSLIRCTQIISMADPEDHWLEPLDLFLKNICKIAIKKRLNWTPNSLEPTLNNFSWICPFSGKYSMKYSLGRNLKLILILKDGEMCKGQKLA